MKENISYGFMGNDGKKYDYNFSGELFYNKFKLQSPKEVFKNGIGVCWDQVEFEREIFKRMKIKHEVIYIIKDDPPQYSTHTFLIYYQSNSQIYYFENSFERYRGIHGPFKCKLDVIKFVNRNMDIHAGSTSKYEYKVIPKMKSGLSCQKYMDLCKKTIIYLKKKN